MPALDIIGLILEIFGWVGLGFGLILLIAAMAARAADSGWREVDVVVLRDGDGPPIARWFTSDDLHERPLDAEEAHRFSGEDDAIGYATAGGRLRFERRSHATRVLGLLTVILLGVGVVALAAGLVLSLTLG